MHIFGRSRHLALQLIGRAVDGFCHFIDLVGTGLLLLFRDLLSFIDWFFRHVQNFSLKRPSLSAANAATAGASIFPRESQRREIGDVPDSGKKRNQPTCANR
jgi:hypothetical protein